MTSIMSSYIDPTILSDNEKITTKNSKPPGRIELPTPGLQDQCSNHWAMEAFNWFFTFDDMVNKIIKEIQIN